MTAYSIMKAGKYEDDMIPKLAIHAFRHAFDKACAVATVVYAKEQQLLQREVNGQETVIRDLSKAYVSVNDLPKVLKRKRTQEAAV
ncbi:hypothetical protein [Acinetobacter terrestris]|uniref:Uncharacterized protein n=1 Tax=Acinetobacter terrestris TaxID=2529843 RepID=A0ABX1UR72_9GAMM|nr:hypothetical protein [Acinetobacter terrestris]NNH25722.1 hypothetical protein [Acinetobacter terrestris]TCB48345.1 hypothetical protein E0H83_00985 [Acinetobacter terrestris]TCB65206.1 hypothetical protein E0H81_06865 [Acinetobacter terrestris]